MREDQAKGSVLPPVRLIGLIIVGIIVGNVAVTLLMNRDTGLGFDELLAFGGGAALGLVVEFGIFRRTRR
ncbi:hypothetical protein ABZ897_31245 [Nonomuraea sp. NPDC046802]|uniref:hypothetical protein n=1 Tax=Nonomuraea sp. NPDC046802 TaxID=3154919 RepID=UPI0033CA3CA2